MTIGFVIINTRSGGKINFEKELEKVGALKKNVVCAYPFAGSVYDFALKIEGENEDELRYFKEEIRNKISDVKSAFVLVVKADKEGPIGFNKYPEKSYVHPSFRSRYKRPLPQ